jgi:AhpD family alkylhydroperoxidase
MTTSNRISLGQAAPAVYQAIDALDTSVELDPRLRELIRIRASQINGCTYCTDYHATDARASGETERRIWALTNWRYTPLFSDRERAALALAEALTDLPSNGLSDEVYAEAARHFDDAELGNLIGAIVSINAWNQVGVGTALRPPAEVEEAVA